jgi:hypothetical protein
VKYNLNYKLPENISIASNKSSEEELTANANLSAHDVNYDLSIALKPIKIIYRPEETQRLITFFTFESMKDEVLYQAQAKMDQVKGEYYKIQDKVRNA